MSTTPKRDARTTCCDTYVKDVQGRVELATLHILRMFEKRPERASFERARGRALGACQAIQVCVDEGQSQVRTKRELCVYERSEEALQQCV